MMIRWKLGPFFSSIKRPQKSRNILPEHLELQSPTSSTLTIPTIGLMALKGMNISRKTYNICKLLTEARTRLKNLEVEQVVKKVLKYFHNCTQTSADQLYRHRENSMFTLTKTITQRAGAKEHGKSKITPKGEQPRAPSGVIDL